MGAPNRTRRLLRIDPMRAGDLAAVVPQPMQADQRPALAHEDLLLRHRAYTVRAAGVRVGCFGTVPMATEGRLHAWALLGEVPTQCWPVLFRALRQAVEDGMRAYGRPRAEMIVKPDWPAGERLARLLGFAPAERRLDGQVVYRRGAR